MQRTPYSPRFEIGRTARHLARAIATRLKSKKWRELDLVARSGLFDDSYYLARSNDVAAERCHPLKHYLEHGWRDGRNPNAYFDGDWYLETYPEVARSNLNPLLDYLLSGWRLGRNPGPRFDTSWYLERFDDVREAGINPLAHYLQWGQAEGRLPKRPGARETVLDRYEAWLAVNQLSARDIAELHHRLNECRGRLPKISVITPVFNTDAMLLQQAVSSVIEQIYSDWELCLINDASTAEDVVPLLTALGRTDGRIRVEHLTTRAGIAAATNAGVEIATGEVIAFLDHDDLLTPDCLAELAIYYAEHPNADVVYSDDDKIDGEGRRYAPQFKPDWSPTLLLSWMYLSHVLSVRRQVFQRLGGFRSEFDGAQDYDFGLRATEVAREVGHIAKILYHWRAVEGSTATDAGAKPESVDRARRAVQEALQRRDIHGARAVHPEWASNIGMFDLAFPDKGPSVTIIVDGGAEESLRCLKSLQQTSYQNYEVVLLDDGTLQSQIDAKDVRVVTLPESMKQWSLSRLRNEAARHCSSDYLLFLSSNAQPLGPAWLSQMVGHGRIAGVGAVGSRLQAEDGSLIHAGKVCGLGEGLVGDVFTGLRSDDLGYLGFARNSREYSAVSGTCLLTPRGVFEELGGFDEANFAEIYTDVDYCLRLGKAGYRCVYCAGAELRCQPALKSNGSSATNEDANFRRRYGSRADRWYNFNLSLDTGRFEVDAIRPRTISTAAVRLLVATHNLNNEGAPRTLTDLVIGLKQRGLIDPIVLSPVEGPLRREYEQAGIAVRVENLISAAAGEGTESSILGEIGSFFRNLGSEVVLANTLNSFWAIKAATLGGLPSIWAQHESDPWESYFDFLPVGVRALAYDAFAEAYRVIYVAEATRRGWKPLETRHNFKLIRHAIPPERLAREIGRWNRTAARKHLGLADDSYVLSIVGTVCRRKGQLDLVKAFALLPIELQRKTSVYLAGKIGEADYADELEAMIEGLPSKVVLAGPVEDPFLYYAASDILVCTSRAESAPRVILEAMACGLPIITTPVFGIPEIVREDVNALFYEPGDTVGLASAIESLLSDASLRTSLSLNSPRVLDSQPDFEQMVNEYAAVIGQAVNLQVGPAPGARSAVIHSNASNESV